MMGNFEKACALRRAHYLALADEHGFIASVWVKEARRSESEHEAQAYHHARLAAHFALLAELWGRALSSQVG